MIDSSATHSSPALPPLGSGLPPLDKPTSSFVAPKINRPVRMPKAVDAWYRLQRIEYIEVVPAEGSSSKDSTFAINVYFRHNQNRIPLNNSRVNESTALLASNALISSPRANSTADFHVVRSSAECEALRASMWESIRQYHPVYCELCNGLTIQMLTSLSNPALLSMTIHRSPAKRAKKMRKFLLSILADLHDKKAMCVPACRGQSDLPLLLHGFLFGDEDAERTDAGSGDSTQVEL